MAHFLNNKCCKLVCISAIALTSLSSCMKDDITSCPTAKLSLKFDYTYNVKEADAFSAEVKNLNVYVFDKNGKFVDNYTESADKFETGHKMEITDLQAGKYTFVCLARDKQPAAMGTRAEGDDETEFSFTKLTPGISTINDLQEEMGKKNEEESVNDKHFTALYTAQDSLNFDGENDVQGKLSLMKCTKTYRVVMLPFEPDQEGFTAENFDVEIKGSAALLDYKGDKVKPKAITYLPYEKKLVENHSGKTEVEGEDVEKALVYDLSSSRMFENKDDNKSRASDGSANMMTSASSSPTSASTKSSSTTPCLGSSHSAPATATAKTGATSSIWTVRTITLWYSTCQLQVLPTVWMQESR